MTDQKRDTPNPSKHQGGEALHPDAQPPISDQPPLPTDEDLPGEPRPGEK